MLIFFVNLIKMIFQVNMLPVEVMMGDGLFGKKELVD